jgi:hypothetical protein
VRPAAEAEKLLGIPSAVVSMPGFNTVGQLAAKAAGVPDVPVVEYPGAVGVDHAEIRDKIKNVLFERIVNALTKPIKPRTPGKASAWDSKKVVFEGSYDEVNAYFHEMDWSDGLPIVPPTLERVEEFLRYTDRSPEEVIAVLPQMNLRATVWNIAANGVMAGCKPQTMPALVALVEALQEDQYNLDNIGTTWGIMPYVFLNGPIVKELGFNDAAGLVSRGANPSFGRALGLIIRNIGGYRPAKNQMGTFGYPITFAFAENEDLNPWEPYHVEKGFDRTASTVSVSHRSTPATTRAAPNARSSRCAATHCASPRWPCSRSAGRPASSTTSCSCWRRRWPGCWPMPATRRTTSGAISARTPRCRAATWTSNWPTRWPRSTPSRRRSPSAPSHPISTSGRTTRSRSCPGRSTSRSWWRATPAATGSRRSIPATPG